nr:response regulator [Ardenticatenaceae bacterium]
MDLILVVDDSPVVRRVLSLTLENNGYIVLTAGNGLEALKIINQQDVRLVFCDIFMPKMNGIEFLKAVRSHRSK